MTVKHAEACWSRRDALRVAGTVALSLGAGHTLEAGRAIGGEHSENSRSDGSTDVLPFVEGSFTIAVLPDTQNYCAKFPRHFYNQTEWLAANREKHAIQFVAHLGDITNDNKPAQWKVARKAMDSLRGRLPYSLLPGNHDYVESGHATVRQTLLNDYFSLSEAQSQPTFGAAMESGRLDNSYHRIHTHGLKLLILALEFAPRDNVVKWASEIVEKHRDHQVIVTTHAYMYHDDTRYDWSTFGKQQRSSPHAYGLAQGEEHVNDGQELWDALVARHRNIVMVISGHALGDGLGRLKSQNVAQQNVHEMLVNFQMKREGGEGYLRLLEFLPDRQTVQVKCYSPSTECYKTDPQNQFIFKLPRA